jgi:hypothetical protein
MLPMGNLAFALKAPYAYDEVGALRGGLRMAS